MPAFLERMQTLSLKIVLANPNASNDEQVRLADARLEVEYGENEYRRLKATAYQRDRLIDARARTANTTLRDGFGTARSLSSA